MRHREMNIFFYLHKNFRSTMRMAHLLKEPLAIIPRMFDVMAFAFIYYYYHNTYSYRPNSLRRTPSKCSSCVSEQCASDAIIKSKLDYILTVPIFSQNKFFSKNRAIGWHFFFCSYLPPPTNLSSSNGDMVRKRDALLKRCRDPSQNMVNEYL